MPHPIVAQFAQIEGVTNFWPLYSMPMKTLLDTLGPQDMPNVEEDPGADIQIERLYQIIHKHLAPLYKETQQVMDLPHLRTILATLNQDLKNHEKSIKRDKAKKYLRDCRIIFRRLDLYLESLIRTRLHLEGRFKSEASVKPYMHAPLLHVGIGYELALRSFEPETVRTESFIDLDIIELVERFALADNGAFGITYDRVETSLESTLNNYLPKEEEEQEKYLLALRALLPDILKHIGTYNRNRLVQIYYSEIFNRIISERMIKLSETEGVKTDEVELAHDLD